MLKSKNSVDESLPQISLTLEPYGFQELLKQQTNRQILAHYDEQTIVVYQAFNTLIAQYAISHQCFGGEGFNFKRTSWIKPSFLWMMQRSGWATKQGQEHILAVRLSQKEFEYILQQAVSATYDQSIYGEKVSWQKQLSETEVLLQWDPDYGPNGERKQRRAIQLGLRGETLKKYSKDWIVKIEDITPFVRYVRDEVKNTSDYSKLPLPKEMPFFISDHAMRKRLGIF